MKLNTMAVFALLSASLLGGALGGGVANPRLRAQAAKVLAPSAALEASEAKVMSLLGSFSLEVSNETGGNVTTLQDDSKLPSTIQGLENTLAELEADRKAGKATPGMENFVSTVTKMIHREMIPAIMKQDRMARRMLKNFERNFKRCGNIRSMAKGRISALKSMSRSTSIWHQSCRKVESKKEVRKVDKCRIMMEKKKAMRAACSAFRALIKNPQAEANVCHTTNAAEPYGLWLTRNKKEFKGKLTAYRLARDRCNVARRAYRRAERPCVIRTRLWDSSKRACTKKQHLLETATCTWAKKIKDTCTTYESCYDQQAAMYKKQKPKLIVQEKDRKGEYRALKRIECLLTSVFGGKEVDQSKIDGCKGKTHSTKHLDLTYPVQPEKQDCDKVPALPRSKIFTKVQYGGLPKNTAPTRSLECVMNPGGGVIMGLEKTARADKCRMENGWMVAQNGGSCLLSYSDGVPVAVDYTKRRFTKYRFTMKMDEVNPRDGQSAGGGFSVCNMVGLLSNSNGKDPVIAFTDSKIPRRWGYHLSGGFATEVYRRRGPVKCKDMMSRYKVWGRTARGIDTAKYTKGKLKWIGCMGDGCSAKSFFCKDQGDSIIFGSTGTLRALLGGFQQKGKSNSRVKDRTKNGVPTRHYGCCSRKHPDSVCNAMDKTKDINALCRMLGYTRGTILSARKTNWCPEVSIEKGGFSSDFANSNGYGNKFRCQGATAKSLYTNKKYYKQAEPRSGEEKKWDLTMEYRNGKYMFRSLKIEGRDFSGYRGTVTKCPAVNKKFAFAPRISAFKTGKVYIKDFRVFQGNRLRSKKPMKQVVGQGVGKATNQKKKVMRAAIRAAKNIPKCSRRGTNNGNRWYRRGLWVYRNGYVRKSRRRRNGWRNSFAILNNVQSAKFRIVQRRYQHIKLGMTRYGRPHIGFPGGVAWGIFPRGRLYLYNARKMLRWRRGDTIAIKIQGRYYCAYHNNRRIRCFRRARGGRANLQIWNYENRDGIKMQSVCTLRPGRR